MNAIFLIAFRNLVYRSSRSILTTAGIAIGIAAAVSVFTLDYNTLRTIKILERGKYGAPDLEVVPDVHDPVASINILKTLRSHPAIARATPLFFTSMTVVQPAGGAIELIGVEPEASNWFGGYYLRDGSTNISLDDQRVIILTQKMARQYRVSIGDSIFFSEMSDIPFRIIGISSNWKLGARNNGNVGFIPFQFGQQTFQSKLQTVRYWIKGRGDLTVEKLQAVLPYGNRVVVPDYILTGEVGDDKVMRDGFRIGGLLTLMLGLYIVFTSLSIALAERIKEIGLMQAIGMSDRQITTVFIVEAAIMALVGAIIGLLGGIALTAILVKLGYSSLGLSVRIWTFGIPKARLALIMLLGLAAAMLGVVYPLFKSRQITIVDALQQRGLHQKVAYSRRLYVVIILLLIIGVPGGYVILSEILEAPWQQAFHLVSGSSLLLAALLSIVFLSPKMTGGFIRLAAWPVSHFFVCEHILTTRTVAHATERVAMSLGTLALVFAGVIGLKHMTISLKAQSQTWADQALNQRIFLTTPLMTPEEYTRFNWLPGVKSSIPMSFTVYAPFIIRGLQDNAFDEGPLSDHRDQYHAFINTPSLLVSGRLAHRYGISSGDSMAVMASDGPRPVPIIMVTDVYGYFIDSSDRDYAVMALDQMKKLFSVETSTANQFTLILEEEADENQVRNEALGWFGRDISDIITGGQKYAWAVKGVDDDFFVFEMLLIITGLLAGIGVMNTLLIGGLERRREFGLLQAVGVTPGQLYRIVLFEGLIIGMAGGVLAILFGLPLSWIIVESLRLLSALPLTFTPDLTWIGISFLASVFVATAAGLYPAWKTLHIPVTESVKYE